MSRKSDFWWPFWKRSDAAANNNSEQTAPPVETIPALPKLGIKYSIGRANYCDVVIHDPLVSRIGYFIRFESPTQALFWTAGDISNLAHATQDGELKPILAPTILTLQDMICIGQTELTVAQIAEMLVSANDIFLSYARADGDIAAKIEKNLCADGWKVWRDPRLAVGRAFDEEIEQALRRSRVAVVLWSESSVQSQWVRAEASLALERNALVPITLGSAEVPVLFRSIQGVTLRNTSKAEIAKASNELSAKLGAILGKD